MEVWLDERLVEIRTREDMEAALSQVDDSVCIVRVNTWRLATIYYVVSTVYR